METEAATTVDDTETEAATVEETETEAATTVEETETEAATVEETETEAATVEETDTEAATVEETETEASSRLYVAPQPARQHPQRMQPSYDVFHRLGNRDASSPRPNPNPWPPHTPVHRILAALPAPEIQS
jgi:hypothetical protein